MDSGREFEGRTIEEALEQASQTLGVPRAELSYEVLEDGRRGFLGLGSRPVRIRVAARDATPRQDLERGATPITRPAEAQRGADPSAGRSKPRSGGVEKPRRGAPPSPPSARPDDEDRRGNRREPAGTAARAASKAGRAEGRPRQPVRSGRREERSRTHAGSQGRRAAQGGGTAAAAGRSLLRPTEEIPYSSQEALRKVAGDILRVMGLELRAKLLDREGSFVLELGGHDAALLLENEGEGIEALQHLLNRILSKDPRFGRRVIVDCEGFRKRHDDRILEKARAAAEEVLETGQPVQLDGLNPYERRLVHLELAGRPGLRTHSDTIGDGEERRLTIEPTQDTTSDVEP